ncbi:MAG: hypothetical protein E7399_05430 [Ruminococcaceae bacterium]|nr:hypothetical protein [Oscillospiraceae bacterium]
MNYFEKALTEFISQKLSKDKKTTQLAELFAQNADAKIICYNAPVSMLEALLDQKPARLLAVSTWESREQKKLAASGKHMISFEGSLVDIQDRIFDVAIIRPESLLTEDLEPLIGQAQRLLCNGGSLIFLGDSQERMYTSLVKHILTESGFGQVRFLSDGDYSCVTCVKEVL